MFLWNAHIAAYSHRGSADHELAPLRMCFKKGRVKVVIALTRGRNVREKRETVRLREADRETRAAVKSRQDRR